MSRVIIFTSAPYRIGYIYDIHVHLKEDICIIHHMWILSPILLLRQGYHGGEGCALLSHGQMIQKHIFLLHVFGQRNRLGFDLKMRFGPLHDEDIFLLLFVLNYQRSSVQDTVMQIEVRLLF